MSERADDRDGPGAVSGDPHAELPVDPDVGSALPRASEATGESSRASEATGESSRASEATGESSGATGEDSSPLHLRPSALAWVFAGGVVGTALRYWIESLLPHHGAEWPWGTFLINLGGAFVLGLLLEGLARLGDDAGWRRSARLCAGTGGCGAFTTYSTFALETVTLGRNGYVGTAIGYGVVSVVAGIVMAWLGIVVAASLQRRRAHA